MVGTTKKSRKTLFNNKRAQEGGSMAGLVVLVIGLLIVFYILFLPPDIREDLLRSGNATADLDETTNKTILLQKVGRLERIVENEVQHSIPSFRLYSKEESTELMEPASIYVSNSWFSKKDASMDFSIEDLRNTKNVLLALDFEKYSGRLIVHLNNKEIYNSEITRDYIDPISLKKELLLQGKNQITISASGVGGAFWSKNFFDLNNVRVIADISDVQTRFTDNLFVVSASEHANLETAELQFFVSCATDLGSKITIELNGHLIYDKVPDCEIKIRQPFAVDFLREGENYVNFKTDEGVYSFYSVFVNSKLKEVINPVYYFDLEKEKYDDIVNNEKDIWLQLTFVDGVEKKDLDISINGRILSIDQFDQDDFDARLNEADISQFIEKASNGIRLIPGKTTDIQELRVIVGPK